MKDRLHLAPLYTTSLYYLYTGPGGTVTKS